MLGVLALALSVPMAASAVPTIGTMLALVLDDGREAVVRDVRGEELLVSADGGVESATFETER